MAPQIDHVVVLMMENRSFDHLLGYLDHPDPTFPRLTGKEQNGGQKVNSAAYFTIDGPDHSHDGVMAQLFGGEDFAPGWRASRPYPKTGTNRGFVQSYKHTCPSAPPGAVMRCLHPAMVPVMAGLAKEFAVCTRWFCSVPGETWPNRDFAVAARSFGHANQHYWPRATSDTIFHRLDAAGASWRIYHDAVAHTFLYPTLYGRGGFASMKRFLDDVGREDLPRYSYIEPDFGIGSDGWLARHTGFTAAFGDTRGNSHHPTQARSAAEFVAGEHLIATIYSALVATMAKHPGREHESLFARTLLVITYDEHGGFFDRVRPPAAPQPTKKDVTDGGFRFDILGPRVPALLISPWIRKGTIVDTTFDHSSIPATVRKLFAPAQPPLTARDAAAKTFDGVLGDTLRTTKGPDRVPTVRPLDRATAEEMAELHSASPNPLQLIRGEAQFRKDWTWLIEKANELSGGTTSAFEQVRTEDEDAQLARAVVARMQGEPAPVALESVADVGGQPPPGPRPRVFIVHGRDLGARAELETCLGSLGLDVVPFEHVADRMAAMPVISDVLREALGEADLIVVLFTPDEQAVLFDPERGRYDEREPGAARWQARANVIFEAGWAFGLRPDRTVFVSIGAVTAMFADVGGHHVIRLDAPGGKAQLRRRLAPLVPRTFTARDDAWVADLATGNFARCARSRWTYHDDLGELRAKLANMDVHGFNLLDLLYAVNRRHPDWEWKHRVPRDLAVALSRLIDAVSTDDAHWWLASIGFYRFSEIEDWGDDWKDSIDIVCFAPRSVVFLEWLRTSTTDVDTAAAFDRIDQNAKLRSATLAKAARAPKRPRRTSPRGKRPAP